MKLDFFMKSELAGRFILELFKQDASGNEVPGTRRKVADFPNLITNGGLNRFGSNADWLNVCRVGSGSTPPAVTDVALVSQIGESTSVTVTNTIQATAPYYSERKHVYRFVPGVGTGNISEVGVGWAAVGNPVFSRALVVDMGGSPTTITKLADETLDVTYILRDYMSAVDTSGTVTLETIDYAWLARAANVTDLSWWTGSGTPSAALTGARAYESGIGVITSQPSGAAVNATITADSYVTGSYQSTGSARWALGAANFATGIGAVSFGSAKALWQIGFTPKIPKINTKELTLNLRYSWARRP